MSVKKREKRFMTIQEKRLRRLMVEQQVSFAEIAEVEGVDQSAISHRLRGLTPSSMHRLERIIMELSSNRQPRKAVV